MWPLTSSVGFCPPPPSRLHFGPYKGTSRICARGRKTQLGLEISPLLIPESLEPCSLFPGLNSILGIELGNHFPCSI